jgi:hypothetical protein
MIENVFKWVIFRVRWVFADKLRFLDYSSSLEHIVVQFVVNALGKLRKWTRCPQSLMVMALYTRNIDPLVAGRPTAIPKYSTGIGANALSAPQDIGISEATTALASAALLARDAFFWLCILQYAVIGVEAGK